MSFFKNFFKNNKTKVPTCNFAFEKFQLPPSQCSTFYAAMSAFLDNEKNNGSDDSDFTEREDELYQKFLEYTDSCQTFIIKCTDPDGNILPLSQWSVLADEEQLRTVQRLQSLIDCGAAAWNEEQASVMIPDAVLAVGMPYEMWPHLGLPDMSGESLAIEHESSPYLANFSIDYIFYSERRRRLIAPVRQGLLFKTSSAVTHLLPPETYIVAETIDQLLRERSQRQIDPKFAWARADAVLSACEAVKNAVAEFSHAKLLTGYRFTAELNDDGTIVPVVIRPKRAGDDDFIPLLLKKEKEAFVKYLNSDMKLSGHVPVGKDTYLFMPKDTLLLLEAVRKINKGSAQDRLSFLANPAHKLASLIDDPAIKPDSLEEIISNVFVETPEFCSDRVKALGPWQKETCSFVKTIPADWFGDTDDRVGVLLDGEFLWLSETELRRIIEKAKKALAQGLDTVEINGTETPLETVQIEELEKCLDKFGKLINEDPRLDDDGEVDGTSRQGKDKSAELNLGQDEQKILFGPDLKRNLHALEYNAQFTKRQPWQHQLSSLNAAGCSLLPHQQECLAWLCSLWNLGCPGALLADDMGLGKTIECLAFLAWIAEGNLLDDKNKPALIIAPAGLRANWLEEGAKWLGERFGKGVHLTSGVISKLKTLPLTEQCEQLEDKFWTVTSYETVRIHQDFFVCHKWGLIVLDEAQKIKTPNSLSTECIKSLKSEFVLAMTGTPVENSFMDLWSIMDAAIPGIMGSAKEFADKWCDDSKIDSSGKQLHDLLLGKNPDQKLCLMMRRLKTDRLKNLPLKAEEITHVIMPPQQAEAYAKALEAAKKDSGEQKNGIALLHNLMSIALMPRRLGCNGNDEITDQDIASSARLTALFKILDEIHEKNEKAVIFVLHLELQACLARKICKRYKMDHIPGIINGSMEAQARQRVVKDFQDPLKKDCFDCVVLTGRAAGTGLTLTAGNHVIHLERWWNPAVEDQCSARCWRIGQEKDVIVHIPVSEFPGGKIKTVDEVLHNFLETKRQRSQSVLMPYQNKNAQAEIVTELMRKS